MRLVLTKVPLGARGPLHGGAEKPPYEVAQLALLKGAK